MTSAFPVTFRHLGAGILAIGLVLAAGCDDDEGEAITPLDGGATGGAGGTGGSPGTGGAGMGTGGTAGGGGATGTPDAGMGTDAAGGAPMAAPVDTDIAVLRLNADGTKDTAFGAGGTAMVDFGPGAGSVRDALWSLGRDGQGRLLLFGWKRGENRADQDRVVARLTPAGAVDTTFGTMGFHSLDIGNLADSSRHGLVQPDGKIVVAGYTSQPTGVGTQSANRIVLLRLDVDGKPDNTFGYMGVVNSAPFVPAEPAKTEWGMAEAYAVALQGDKYVTTGYGRRASSGQVDMVSFRYTAPGDRDTTWGTNGVAELDLVGDNDRGRYLLTLPNDRILIVGSGTPRAMNVDAMVVILQASGALDATFGMQGSKLWDFGRADEAFYHAALSADGKWAAVVGYRSSGAMSTDNDDALLLLLPIDPAAGAEVAKAVPLSMTAHDRFWGVAFGPDGKVYAAGYVAEGSDTRMAVARFDTAGNLDATFGTGGVAAHNVVMAGNVETVRGIVVQPDGRIVIAGEVEKK